MKKIVSKKKTRFFTIVLLCLFALAAVILPAASAFAEAKAIHPWITQEPWTGEDGGGGTNDPTDKRDTTVFINKSFAEELSYLPIKLYPGSNNDDMAYYLPSYDSINTRVASHPNPASSYNTIDHMLFMVRELEELAKEYIQAYNVEDSTAKVKNLVLGYVRGINANYSAGKLWDWSSGSIDTNFITYVREHDAHGGNLSILEFFASYLQDANLYNRSVYGDIDAAFLNKHYTLPDPLGSGQSIDLIHMFASIDGIFQSTEQNIAVTTLAHNLQRQAISWLGDLVTFSSDLKEFNTIYSQFPTYSASMGHIDFNEIVNNNSMSFSSNDLLADIDAFNCVKFFLDNSYNSLASSIAAYYNETPLDSAVNGNRYYQFIFTSVLEKTKPTDSRENILDHFKDHVYYFLNLKRTGEGAQNYHYYADEMGFVGGNVFISFLESGLTAPTVVRTYCAQLFCDYIVIMSHRT